MGYSRAGFEVVGVDIKPQPRYPFEFVQLDAFEALDVVLVTQAHDEDTWLDAIHASPPCQAYIRSGVVAKDGRHSDLLGPTRELLVETGLPWVIENVPGAPMRPDAVLCGSQFGLEIRRHRWFEFSWAEPLLTFGCDHSHPITGVYGHPHGKNGANAGMLPSDHATWSRALGIDWMKAPELANAIPPAYTEFIGTQLMAHLKATVSA